MRIEIGFGCGRTKDGYYITAEHRREPIARILEFVGHKFGGFNLVHGQGGWWDGSKLVLEESCTLTIDTDMPAAEMSQAIADTITLILAVLNQEAVHLTSFASSSEDIH